MTKKGRLCSFAFMVAAGMAGIFFFIPAIAAAQIPVSQEPRHHTVLENEWVRILDVRIPPGDTTLMHIHSTPSVFIVLSHTKTGSEVLKEPSKVSFSDGRVWFESFHDTPRIHRVWNDDTVEFHVMDIELLRTNNRIVKPPAPSECFRFLFDEKAVFCRIANIPMNVGFNVGNEKTARLVVLLTENKGTVTGHYKNGEKKLKKKGDFFFVPPGNWGFVLNEGDADESMAVFELK